MRRGPSGMTAVRKRPLRQALGATERGPKAGAGASLEGAVCVSTRVRTTCGEASGPTAVGALDRGRQARPRAACWAGGRGQASPPPPACLGSAVASLGPQPGGGRAARRMCQLGSSQRGLAPQAPAPPGPRGRQPPRPLQAHCSAQGRAAASELTRCVWSPPNAMALAPSGPMTFPSSDSLK